MTAGRKAPPWRQGPLYGARNRRRKGVHPGLARQILFAASPLLLLVIGCLSSLTFGVVAVEARAGAAREGGGRGGRGGLGGLGGGSFGLWGSSGHDESGRKGERPQLYSSARSVRVICCYHTRSELYVE